MYAVHLRLIGKPVENLLLLMIELFSPGAMVEGLRPPMSKYRLEVAVFEGVGHLGPKISRRKGRPPPTTCAWLDRPVDALQLCH